MGRKQKHAMVKSKVSGSYWVHFIDFECEICARLHPETHIRICIRTSSNSNKCLCKVRLPDECINRTSFILRGDKLLSTPDFDEQKGPVT